MIKMGIRPTGIITVEKGRGDIVTQRLKFTNVVLNVGWDYVYARTPNWGTDYIYNWDNFYSGQIARIFPRYLYLGTGTSEPHPTDLGLQSVSPTLAGKEVTGMSSFNIVGGTGEAGDPRYHGIRAQWTYTAGQAEGTWTELGLAYGSTYTNPYNRALFRDQDGIPIAITVLGDEWLRIFVELRLYLPTTDSCGKSGESSYNGSPFQWSMSYDLGGKNFNLWGSRGPAHSSLLGRTISGSGGNIAAAVSLDNANHRATYTYQKGPGEANTNMNRFSFTNTRNQGSAGFFFLNLTGTLIEKPLDETLEGQIIIDYFRGCTTQDSGTVSSADSTSLTDTTKAWTVDAYAGMRVTLLVDSNCIPGQERRIVSNTTDTLTVDPPWDVIPDNTVLYEVCGNG